MAEEISAHRIPQIQIQKQALPIEYAKDLEFVVPVDSDAEFQQWIEQGAFNPSLMARRFEQLEIKTRRSTRKEDEKAEKAEGDQEPLYVKRLEEISEQFERRNHELHARALLLLRSRLRKQDTHEDILSKALEMYPDYSLADEAIEFLQQTTEGDLAKQTNLAKETLNTLYGREVRAGRNIVKQAQDYASQGLGTTNALRELYRDITGNPRDAALLFNELSTQFNFEKMKPLIEFLLHSLGGDLKSKGPSISPGELHRLITETRKLQSILGLYFFFRSRMNLIGSAFQRQQLTLPRGIDFEALSKLFMKFLQERYPTSDKILQMAAQLGLSDEWIGQVIVFTQMRDGVREVAPKLFKSQQHQQDVLKSYIDAIEDLDKRLEEGEEEEDEEADS
jgi:type III secretion protein W